MRLGHDLPRVAIRGLVRAALAGCGAPAPLPSPPPGAIVIAAEHTAYAGSSFTAPAGVAFTLFFENRDNEPHNVRFWDAAGQSVFSGEIIQGPAAKVEPVPALAPGTYRITCDIHPDMTAQLVAQ